MRNELQNVMVGARKFKATIEYRDHWSGGPEWMMMNETGHIASFDTAQAAFDAVWKRAKRGNKTVTITTIEWRNVPDGFVPPKEAK